MRWISTVRARRSWTLIGVLLLASATLVACGSSGTSAAPGGSSGTGITGGKSALNVTSIVDVSSPSGNSLAYGVIASAAKATVEYFNGHGGFGGRRINLTVCDSQNDPNVTATCARNAVQDKAVAVVGSYAQNADQILPILEAAQIPYIPSYPQYPSELSSSVSFPINSGPLLYFGMAYVAGKVCKSPSLALIQLPQDSYYVNIVNKGLALSGKTLHSTTELPANVTDYSPYVSRMTSGSDCVIMITTALQSKVLYPEMAQSGVKTRIIGYYGNSLGGAINAIAPAVTDNGIDVSYFLPYSNPSWDQYKLIVKDYGNPSEYSYAIAGAQLAYLNFVAFRNVLTSLQSHGGAITSKTILTALQTSTLVADGGLMPAVNFTKPWQLVPSFSRLFNRSVTFAKVVNGVDEPLSGYPQFVDLGADYAK